MRRKTIGRENYGNAFSANMAYYSFCRIARKLKAEDFTRADSFRARDKIMRILAAECFESAERFAKEENQKLAFQYTKLSAKLLGLSLSPKKLRDLETIKKTLAELKAKEKFE